METKAIRTAKQLNEISRMADNALLGGNITKEERQKIREKERTLELDNLFRAMAAYCSK